MLCVVSDRFDFICLLIAKNASTSLRLEFGKEIYDSYEQSYSRIDPPVRDRYFTFAALRDPVSRLHSAYQEISRRFEMGEQLTLGRRFFPMDDTPERFDTFLDELGDACWDPHLLPQVNSLAGVRADFFTRVERLQEGIEEVFSRLELETCPVLPIYRSRKEREEGEGYSRFLLSTDDLDEKARSLIERVYEADIRLYSKLFPDA